MHFAGACRNSARCILLTAIAACDIIDPEPARIASIEIAAEPDTVTPYRTIVTLRATLRDADGKVLTDDEVAGRPVVWQADGFEVDSQRLATTMKWKEARTGRFEPRAVTLSVGNAVGNGTVVVCDAQQLASQISQKYIVGRSSIALPAELRGMTMYPVTIDAPITWRSTNASVLAISSQGTATALAVGTTSVIASGCGIQDSLEVDVISVGHTATFLGTGRIPVAINSAGQVVGSTSNAAPYWLWTAGVTTDLGDCAPRGISSAGTVLCSGPGPRIWENGLATTRDTFPNINAPMNGPGHVLLWRGGALNSPAIRWRGPGDYVPNGTFSANVVDLSDSASAAGHEGTLYQHGVLWHAGARVSLGGYGRYNFVRAVNDSGDAVGYTEDMGLTGSNQVTALIWKRTNLWSPVRLRRNSVSDQMYSIPNRVSQDAVDINFRGQVIGSGYRGSFVWERGKLALFSHILADTNWRITSVKAINNAGWIIGQGTNNATGQTGAVLITPP